MELLQLSSISAGWINFGAIDLAHGEATPESVFLAALVAVPPAMWAVAQADPHFNVIRTEEHHLDGDPDEGCIRIAKMLNLPLETATPEDKRETMRRIVTAARGWRGLVARLVREDARRQEAAV